MLKQFSRMEKTRSLVIIIFALMMGLSLVLFYAPGARDSAGSVSAMSREVLARVRGEKITVADVERLVAEKGQEYRMQLTAMQLGGTRSLLDGLILKRIIKQEAERLALTPSDAEVRDFVKRNNPDPATGGFVGFERYKEQVVAQFGSVEAYEQTVRDYLANQKLQAFVTAGVAVSEDDILREWERDNTKFDLVYVPVTAAELAKQVTATDDEVAAYYNDHQGEFFIAEPQKKIRYLFISQTKMGEKLNISDDELRKEFNALKDEAKVAGVRVQQIVLKVPSKAEEQIVLARGSRLLQGVRGDDQTMAEDKFAELARGNSQDTATKDSGGWLPNPVKKDPNKRDIYQTVFTMEEGQVNDPVYDDKTKSFYIFRRGPQIEKTFETAKPELLASLRNNRAYTAASALAQRAADRLKETKDFDAVARELAPEANMRPAEMIKTTDFIKPQDKVPDIGSNPQFEEGIAPLTNAQDVGERTPVPNGFAVPMLLEKRDPRTPPLEEIRDKVTERAREAKAKSQLEEKARELAAANSPDELRAAAARLGLKAEEVKEYTLKSALGAAGTSTEADDAISALDPGQVTKNPVKIGDTWVVVGATDRKGADPAQFTAQREELVDAALTKSRQQVFEDYVADVRARLERGGEIKVYEDVLSKVTALEKPPVAAPRSRTVPVETDGE